MFAHMSYSFEQFATLPALEVALISVNDEVLVEGVLGDKCFVAHWTLMWPVTWNRSTPHIVTDSLQSVVLLSCSRSEFYYNSVCNVSVLLHNHNCVCISSNTLTHTHRVNKYHSYLCDSSCVAWGSLCHGRHGYRRGIDWWHGRWVSQSTQHLWWGKRAAPATVSLQSGHPCTKWSSLALWNNTWSSTIEAAEQL